MIHEDLGLVRRSAMKSRKHGGETMIRKAYWGVLASLFLALAFGTGCNSTATPPPSSVTTVAASGAYQQNAVTNTQFGSPFKAQVTTNGAIVVGATVVFTAPGAGAGGTFNSVGGSSTASATTDATGTATSPNFYADGTVGTYNVIASSAGTSSTATFNCANTLQPTMISTAGGTPQSTTEGTQFNNVLSVTLLDAANASPGAQLVVTFTAPDGTFADSLSNTTTALTNSSGVATAAAYTASSVVSGTTPYTVTATAENGLSATFTLSNTIMPAAITPVSGSTPQSTTSGTLFANLLSVTVVDATTPVPLPVVGAYVTFTAPAQPASPAAAVPSGAFFDPTVVPPANPYDLLSVSEWTDATGTATAPAFEANATAGGPYNVTATVVVQSGTTLTANFALTNQ
jgi:hypothetical protein